MRIYFAPLEGVTDGIFRRAHCECFSGVEKYFIPFVSPSKHLSFTSREQRSVSPEENAGVPAVPQILTKDAECFNWMAQALADVGWRELNLNLGCPSGTVTAKGKGSGMLRDRAALRAFLDEIFARPALKISVKTRIGFESPDEWPALMEIFADYPIAELIVHPRTRAEFYRGRPHRELLEQTLTMAKSPLAYNGDLFTAEDCRAMKSAYPGLSALMLGRGLVSNPALAQELSGGEGLTVPALRAFHDRIYREYCERWPQNAMLGHMREIVSYMLCDFEDTARIRRAMRKVRTLSDYEAAAAELFETRPLRETPGFTSLKEESAWS